VSMQVRPHKLTPIDLSHPDWADSTRKGECIVYAIDERSARACAKQEFRVATIRQAVRRLSQDPWGQPGLVECREIADTGSSDLPEGVIVIGHRASLS
jgi:hypothetical protein